ncbi:uncharacterized protein LOC143426015 [Xylocopa sonorina]|uniref:uncharacterized protein LOC143426015 n=1 Tax=Xylocopa sonorina TaxID=1818115 RepID=UPI00403AEDC9
MKTFAAVISLLAATTVVRGMDQDEIIAKYLEYLMPDIQPCVDEFHIDGDEIARVQHGTSTVDVKQLGCMKACVMKRMQILTGTDLHLEPIHKMIEVIHAGNEDDVKLVKKLAGDCAEQIKGEADECEIGTKYTDCYIEKLFSD